MKTSIELAVRAIIINKNKILLCQLKNSRYYFLPGGHIEFGETAENSLHRELKEEFGAAIIDSKVIGLVENFFISKNIKHHEINLIYYTHLKSIPIKSLEKHLLIYWLPLTDIKKIHLEPRVLGQAIIVWTKNKKHFHLIENF